MKLIKIDVKCSGEVKRTENISESGFSLTLSAEKKAEIISASATFAFTFGEKDRLFLNGYQSWTLSREFSPSDRDNTMRYCPKFLDKKFGFSMYGDGHFYKHSYKRGVFHGYSYAYIRRGEEFFLLGSLAESTGYTRIIFDSARGVIRLEKDCEKRRFKGEYTVFNMAFLRGTEDKVFDEWFNLLGVKPLTTKKRTGYTSWYNYYQNISEGIILNDLKAMRSLSKKPDVFQIDDGFETKVGDWLSVDEKKFSGGLKPVAEAIKNEGLTAGLWLAPFVCERESALYSAHPDWLLKGSDGKPVFTGVNWSGMYALDFYNTEVRAYIKSCIEHYKNLGFTLFKLDFLYAACVLPRRDKTRAEIMYEAMDFLRETCGESAILGCGVPLLPAFGKVEYCRIGMDMSLSWDDKAFMRLFHSERPSTKHTMLNTIYRRQLSGRAFLNDPDVFLLRDYNVSLSGEQKLALGTVNGLFGGVLFVSDDFSRYSAEQKKLYEEILALAGAENITAEETNGLMKISYTLLSERRSLTYKI